MFRVAICDDSELECQRERELVLQLLKERDIAFSIKTYTDPEKLANDLRRGEDCFQLLLLDILMGEANGVSFAKRLRRQNISAELIFITSCPDYALESFETEPLQYLLKPVKRADLERALDRALSRWMEEPLQLLVETRTGIQMIPVDEIEYVEVFNHTVQVHRMDSVISCNGALTEMEGRLPSETFCRCHRSFLINLSKIREIRRKSVLLESGTELPIGRSNYGTLQEAFICYAEGVETRHG